jgi:hypothetical protein
MSVFVYAVSELTTGFPQVVALHFATCILYSRLMNRVGCITSQVSGRFTVGALNFDSPFVATTINANIPPINASTVSSIGVKSTMVLISIWKNIKDDVVLLCN